MSPSHRPGVRTRAGLVVTAAITLAVPAFAGTAGAATSTPAKGSATSALTLVKVASGSAYVTALTAALTSDTLTSPAAAISITPVSSSATGDVGKQTISADATKTVSGGTVALPAGLGSLTGPSAALSATKTATDAVATLTASGLGTLSILGANLSLGSASLSDTSKTTSTASTAQKSLTVSSVALPSIADLLKGLGLDLSKLTQDQLTALAGIVSAAVATINSQIDSLQTQLGTTVDTVAGATTLVSSKQADLTAATTTLTNATTAFNTAFAAVPLATINPALTLAGLPTISGTQDIALWNSLSAAQKTLIDGLTAADLTSLAGAVATAQTAVNAAQALVDAAQALLTALTNLLTTVTSALDANPLASLGNIKFATTAVASNSPTADATATIGSLDVLGAAKTVNGTIASVTTALSPVLTQLTNVLNGITGITFTPPSVALATPQHSTGVDGAFKTASASVTGLTITMPSITLPSALALPNVSQLSYLTSTAGGLVSAPATVQIANLSETARYAPGTTATPTTTPATPSTPQTPTSTPSLPNTGGSPVLPAVGLLMVAGAVALRLRKRATAEA